VQGYVSDTAASPAEVNAFKNLRDRLLSPSVLALPRAEGQIWLGTDASDAQLGCCLLQQQPDGKPLSLGILIAYVERRGAQLFHYRNRMPRYCLGSNPSAALSRGRGLFGSHGSPHFTMGNESLQCAGSVGVVASSAGRVHIQSGVLPQSRPPRRRCPI
jgi:hypothetical protein